MSPDAPTLALLLDSPLQSWGEGSRFNRRSTGSHPTKSGIVSLLACARGIDKHSPDEETLLAPLAALNLSTVRLPRIRRDWRNEPRLNAEGLALTHRAHRLTDYHTIGGGFDEKEDTLRIPRKATRGGVFGTVQTWRNYLLDIRFGVLLQGARDELDRCRNDLTDPVWGLWLGRKSCPPSVPVLGEVHDDLAGAWAWIANRAGFPESTALESFERYEEVPPDSGEFTILDQPVSFRRREFHARSVRRHLPT